jgi:AcrR family transcriptional regulator
MTAVPTLERIIGATLELVTARGLGNVTMSDIAKTAGVARQTLYNHFTDVDGIVAHAIGQHNDESIRQLRSAAAVVESPGEKLTQLVRHIAQTSAHPGHDLDFEHSLAPEYRGLFVDYTRALDDLLRDIIAQGIDDGSFRADLEPDLAAVLVRQQFVGLSQLVASDPAGVANTTDHTARLILAGLDDESNGT